MLGCQLVKKNNFVISCFRVVLNSLTSVKMYGAPVIKQARKRTEFDYNYLAPEDRRRLERPSVRLTM